MVYICNVLKGSLWHPPPPPCPFNTWFWHALGSRHLWKVSFKWKWTIDTYSIACQFKTMKRSTTGPYGEHFHIILYAPHAFWQLLYYLEGQEEKGELLCLTSEHYLNHTSASNRDPKHWTSVYWIQYTQREASHIFLQHSSSLIACISIQIFYYKCICLTKCSNPYSQNWANTSEIWPVLYTVQKYAKLSIVRKNGSYQRKHNMW